MHLANRALLIVPAPLLPQYACGGGHSSGRVAVIDLDKVATSIGRDKIISGRVQSYTKEQEQALIRLRDDSRAEIDKQQKQLPAKASEEARKKVTDLKSSLERDLRQEIAKAQQGAGQRRVKRILAFRVEIEPIARRGAAGTSS